MCSIDNWSHLEECQNLIRHCMYIHYIRHRKYMCVANRISSVVDCYETNLLKGYMTPMGSWYRWWARHLNINLWKLFSRFMAFQRYKIWNGVIYRLRGILQETQTSSGSCMQLLSEILMTYVNNALLFSSFSIKMCHVYIQSNWIECLDQDAINCNTRNWNIEIHSYITKKS